MYGYGADNYSWHDIGIETFSVSASGRQRWYYYPGHDTGRCAGHQVLRFRGRGRQNVPARVFCASESERRTAAQHRAAGALFLSALKLGGPHQAITVRSAAPRAPWRLGVDVGGTFTDLVLADADGHTWVAKVPSVPSDPSRGVLAAVSRVAADLELPVGELLAGCALFVHGSTVATNTMLEHKGATVGLLTTQGHRDALEIRRGLREDQWNHREPYAPVLVPRYLRHGVAGRIDASGNELEPLSAEDVEAAVQHFEAEGVEAVAIALFNSFVNEGHEVEAETALRQHWDGAWVTRSAEISPMMGEYERTSTAVVNATLAPRVVSYLRDLDAELARLGLPRPILLVQSNGGAASVETVVLRAR